MAEKNKENQEQGKSEPRGLEGFMTDNDILKEMGLGGEKSCIKQYTKTKFELINKEVYRSCINALSNDLEDILPKGCTFEIVQCSVRNDKVRSQLLVDGYQFIIYMDKKRTGDEITITPYSVVYNGNGNRRISQLLSTYLMLLVILTQKQKIALGEKKYTQQIIQESLKFFKEDLEQDLGKGKTNKTDYSLDYVMQEVEKAKPEILTCKPETFDLSDLIGDLDTIIAKRGSLFGIAATNSDHVAPDSNNAGVIEIKKKSEFSDIIEKYKLSELGATHTGAIVINYILEKRYENVLSFAKRLPQNYRAKVQSIINEIKYSTQNPIHSN